MNSKIFSEAMSELDSKYIEEAVNYKKRSKKTVWIIAGAAMAACFCVFIIAAVFDAGGLPENSGNRPNTAIANDGQFEFVALDISGTYCLNGDKNSDVWIEIDPNYIIIKGADIDTSVRDAIIKGFEEDSRSFTDEDVDTTAKYFKEMFCTEMRYAVEYIGFEKFPYTITYGNDDPITGEFKPISNGLPYDDKTKTIRSGLFGEFILVE